MTTSGTYIFNPSVDDIIADAYERCGIDRTKQTAIMLRSAIYSLNMQLVEFANRQLNLWSVEKGMLATVPGQNTYSLPTGTVDLLDVTRRTATRALSGTAYSSAGGTAANAFDNDLTTACTQTSANGYISYDYGAGATQSIELVGIRSNSNTTYNLVVEVSSDNSTWINKLSVGSLAFTNNETKWYVIQSPAAFRYIRVRETGGAILDIAEIYFETALQDLTLDRYSRQDYMAIPNKNNVGVPTMYYVDRVASPTLSLWQAPSADYPIIFYTRIRQAEAVLGANSTMDVPYRFLEALTAGLAVKLASKVALDRVNPLKAMYDESLTAAREEDRERVPLVIKPSWGI